MKNILPIAAIIGAGAFLLNYLKGKKQAGENLKFELFKISIDSQKTKRALFLTVFYDIVLNVINEETESVNIKNVLLNIKINEKDLGKIESNLNLVIPRQSKKQITIKASFSSFGAFGLIKDIVTDGLQVAFNIQGFIETDLGRVNINFNKEF
jgi:LEA14-like dessication related protein